MTYFLIDTKWHYLSTRIYFILSCFSFWRQFPFGRLTQKNKSLKRSFFPFALKKVFNSPMIWNLKTIRWREALHIRTRSLALTYNETKICTHTQGLGCLLKTTSGRSSLLQCLSITKISIIMTLCQSLLNFVNEIQRFLPSFLV